MRQLLQYKISENSDCWFMSKSTSKKFEHNDDLDETANLPTLLSANDSHHRATVTNLESRLVAEQLKHLVRLTESMNRTLEQIAISLKPGCSDAPKSVRKKKKKTGIRKKVLKVAKEE
jgi:gamma-glutamyl:cysteine ligase YbdK (ATP-grasp superfamily)